jgi:hypothetical protein
MYKAFVLVPVLAGAGLAAYAYVSSTGSNVEVAVVTVPPPVSEPSVQAPPPQAVVREPGDHASLVKEIQRELKRVGCYRGQVTGVWTASTRAAMRAFLDDVNAVLPFDRPDHILLNLVHGRRDRACGTSCPEGAERQDDGSCGQRKVVLGDSTRMQESSQQAAMGGAEPRPPMPDATGGATLQSDAPAEVAVVIEEAPMPTAQVSEPRAEVRERRPRRSARRAQGRPPKLVRSLIRNIKRGLAPLGIP